MSLVCELQFACNWELATSNLKINFDKCVRSLHPGLIFLDFNNVQRAT